MNFDLAKGYYKKDVVLYYGANQNVLNFQLPHKFENVKQILLIEYSVVAPNGGAVSPNLWRLDIGPQLAQNLVTNAVGSGACLIMDSAICSHTHYDTPIIYSLEPQGAITSFSANFFAVTAAGLVPATFTEATVFLTFIMQDKAWMPDQAMLQYVSDPQNAKGQFSTRSPFL